MASGADKASEKGGLLCGNIWSSHVTGVWAVPISVQHLGSFLCFVNIDRVSFLTPPTDRSWTAVITHSTSSSRGRLGGSKEVWNHIGSPGGHRERNLMGQGQAFWVAPPHSLPGRKPLTEECPGAQDPQLWTGSGGSGATLLQDSTPAQGSPLHSD